MTQELEDSLRRMLPKLNMVKLSESEYVDLSKIGVARFDFNWFTFGGISCGPSKEAALKLRELLDASSAKLSL